MNASRFRDGRSFTVHLVKGADLIVQSFWPDKARPIEYAPVRKLADGASLVVPINEADADEATRVSAWHRTGSSPCRIETADQLSRLPATAAKTRDRGGARYTARAQVAAVTLIHRSRAACRIVIALKRG